MVKDPSLAPMGRVKMRWAKDNMPVLARIRKRFAKTHSFKGQKIGMCLHLEAKTAVLAETFQESGAEVVAITGSNPLSTQDDVAASLAESGVKVFAWRGVTPKEQATNVGRVLDTRPDILIDDGAELTIAAHMRGDSFTGKILGACEETTTGIVRLRAMEAEGRLRFPVLAVNDALTKYLFDSRYGTGQSGLEGFMRATNLMIAGRDVVVAGYGWVGRGVAERAKGLGARVTVTEVNPVRALEALMEGYGVMPMTAAAEQGDLFITATGDTDVITEKHMMKMRDGAILCNVGHFNVEVSVRDLERVAVRKRQARPEVTEYTLPNGRRLYLLSEGRLVNLAAADGHPAEVMDMSFADQALSAEYLKLKGKSLPPKLLKVPDEIDLAVARERLGAFGRQIDKLTAKQERYLRSWH